MGVEFIDETVSGGLWITRRTVACEVCRTVFLADWPPQTTTCRDCAAPVCAACLPEHQCRNDEALRLRQHRFYERLMPQRRS